MQMFNQTNHERNQAKSTLISVFLTFGIFSFVISLEWFHQHSRNKNGYSFPGCVGKEEEPVCRKERTTCNRTTENRATSFGRADCGSMYATGEGLFPPNYGSEPG